MVTLYNKVLLDNVSVVKRWITINRIQNESLY